MKTILITGINGFLGSYLAKSLALNNRVIGLEYSLDNLFRLDNTSFKVYSTQRNKLEKVFEENSINIIIHTATFYGRNDEDLQQIAETNFIMPFHLLDIAIKNKVSLFINTDTVLDRFVSPYALTKRQFQEWLYLRRKEIRILNMKLEHIYGPGASASNFINSMISRLKSSESFIDLTLGEQKRDFVYIDDVVSAFHTVLENDSLVLDDYTCHNVASKELLTIKYIITFLKESLKTKTRLNFGSIPYRENELLESSSDNTSLTKLGWKPNITLEKGLLKTINYYNENK